MLILHANWICGAFHLWAESLDLYLAHSREEASLRSARDNDPVDVSQIIDELDHPFLIPPNDLVKILTERGYLPPAALGDSFSFSLLLPHDQRGPCPSTRLGSMLSEHTAPVGLCHSRIHALTLDNPQALSAMLALEDRGSDKDLEFGHSLRYWITVSRFVLELLVDQRFIPTLLHSRDSEFTAAWQPWLHDEPIRLRVGALISSMPPVVRAVTDLQNSHPWLILDDALCTLTDITVRQVLQRDDFSDALDERDPADPHVAWLAGLLGSSTVVPASHDRAVALLRDVAGWVGCLDDTGQDQPLRLCFRLNEPLESSELEDLQPVSNDVNWRLSLHMQYPDDPHSLLDADLLWSPKQGGRNISSVTVGQPHEVLLSELARASRIYPKLEKALAEATPTGVDLSTNEAYEFLREYLPVLEESGFVVQAPNWWQKPQARIGAVLQIESPTLEKTRTAQSEGIHAGKTILGLNHLVRYNWQIAVGDQPLTLNEFENLARQKASLLRLRGQWVEILPEQIDAAMRFFSEHPGGEVSLREAFQLAHGFESKEVGVPIQGLTATGWVEQILQASGPNHRMPMLDQPHQFQGTLRPYQKVGLSWLAFLDQFGLGACLADDMGLGKTIQLIALLLHERQQVGDDSLIGPTLLIVPTSLIGNWSNELRRFAPELMFHVQHGPDRPSGEEFARLAHQNDVVITTYALVNRDRDTLQSVTWHRVVLDEAQYIKNPPTKQTSAIRGLKANRRLAMTGTPVENRLSELWSIMDFCNPGYLETAGTFRRRFSVPIERHRDHERAEHLRKLVQPYILRRVKTDPKVLDDLPPCVITREYATLTHEQAAMYQRVVDSMLSDVDQVQGIRRRGLVLATLVKLKQICNHPAQAAASGWASRQAGFQGLTITKHDAAQQVLSTRSGKASRLMTMLEEILAGNERALVFSQFRQMGHLLTSMIQHDLDAEVQFMHGGTPQSKRQSMIDHFQRETGPMVFVLSLKAGGVGLNLTAANHVFHYDRWWNPAVENQATDRAFRIGQARTVHVHKFICLGTLEERIDEMIEQKTELADNIIGAGESWLTELSTEQLQDIFTLRTETMEKDT